MIATSGKYKGTTILQDRAEQGTRVHATRSTDAQRKKAISQVSKTGNNNVGEAFKDNVVLDYAGVPCGRTFAESSRQQLLDLIERVHRQHGRRSRAR